MRIMMWNIQFFTLKTIRNLDGDSHVRKSAYDWKKLSFQQRQILTFQQAEANRRFILDTIEKVDPAIFILIENRSSAGKRGTLQKGEGKAGILLLLTELRLISPHWCLIPPVRNNPKTWQEKTFDGLPVACTQSYCEAMAIFYRNDLLEFTGPWSWTGDRGAADGDGEPYPRPWQSCLPDGNYFALQSSFYDGDGNQVEFPHKKNRSPVLANFDDLSVLGDTLTLVAAHLPPRKSESVPAASILANIRELTEVQQPKNVTVVAADFNIDNREDWTFLHEFIKTGADFLNPLRSLNTATMIQSVDDALLHSYLKDQALDNMLVRYGSDLSDYRPQLAVIDRVAGWPRDLALSALQSTQEELGQDTEDARKLFRQITNYGCIGPNHGVSDHLPLVVDV